jgi:hypothetical protein
MYGHKLGRNVPAGRNRRTKGLLKRGVQARVGKHVWIVGTN